MRCSTSSRGNCAPASSARRRVGRRGATRRGSAEDRLIARYFKPLAKHPGALGLTDEPPRITPPAGPRPRAHDRRASIARRAFLSRRSAGWRRAQGAAREPVGSRRQGRGAARLPAGARAAEGLRRRLARGVRARARRGCRSTTTARCSAATRFDARADHDLDRGVRHAADAARWCGAPARRRATTCSSPARSAMRRSGCCCARTRRRRWKLDAAMSEHLVARYLLPQPRNALAEAVRAHATRRDGCVRRARRRSRQALPRLGRVGRDRGRARAAVGRGARTRSPPTPR